MMMCRPPPLAEQRQAQLELSASGLRSSTDAERTRLLALVSQQAAALSDKERQLEVCSKGG
jgi:hypothetical protein